MLTRTFEMKTVTETITTNESTQSVQFVVYKQSFMRSKDSNLYCLPQCVSLFIIVTLQLYCDKQYYELRPLVDVNKFMITRYVIKFAYFHTTII